MTGSADEGHVKEAGVAPDSVIGLDRIELVEAHHPDRATEPGLGLRGQSRPRHRSDRRGSRARALPRHHARRRSRARECSRPEAADRGRRRDGGWRRRDRSPRRPALRTRRSAASLRHRRETRIRGSDYSPGLRSAAPAPRRMTRLRISVMSSIAKRTPSRPRPLVLDPAIGHVVDAVARHVVDRRRRRPRAGPRRRTS